MTADGPAWPLTADGHDLERLLGLVEDLDDVDDDDRAAVQRLRLLVAYAPPPAAIPEETPSP